MRQAKDSSWLADRVIVPQPGFLAAAQCGIVCDVQMLCRPLAGACRSRDARPRQDPRGDRAGGEHKL